MRHTAPKSITPKTVLLLPLEVILSLAVGLAAGAGGAAATTYSVAYSIRDQAIADMREVIRGSIADEATSRKEALSHKVDKSDLIAIITEESAKRDRQFYQVIGRLQAIEAFMRRKL